LGLVLFLPGGLGSLVTAGRDRFVRWAARRHGLDLERGERAGGGSEQDERPEPTIETELDDLLLDVRGVDAGYGSVQVLFGALLQVGRGEVVALLGTNGAGKSTLLKVIAGLLPKQVGAVALDGRDLDRLDAAQRAAAGMALMPGGRSVFPSLTVEENLRLGGWLHRGQATVVAAEIERVLALFPALAERRATRAGLLSGGQQQMLGLALALLSRPRLLLIDELSLGLAPAVVSQLLDAVRALNHEGTTVVIVEQSLNVAAAIAGRAVFLERGSVRFAGPTADLLERDDLARAVFLGAEPTARPRPRAIQPTRPPPIPTTPAPAPVQPALAVSDLTVRFGGVDALRQVGVAVGPREVVGIIGSNGAGKTTLLDACSGFVDVDTGSVRLDGDDITGQRAAARATRGLGRSFQGARLFPALTVTETIALALERHIDVREPFACALALPATRRSEEAVRRRVDELVEQLQLGRYRNAFVAELSTGTRRIVELACAMAHRPTVLLLDEPSAGLAQRETEALGGVLTDLRRELGAALVIVEHDIPLVSGIADRLICLHLGRVLAEGPPDQVLANPAVVASYLGTDDASVARSGARAGV
ncbi:MAG: ATP-binding cassette domain-containing protein, partial [Acidimicrobiales bacterium]